MIPESFPAYVLRKDDAGQTVTAKEELSASDLPDGDVLVRVTHSSLNYKDGLAVTGKGKIARSLPMVAGIDLAGTVVESSSPDWSVGESVLSNGWGLGEERFGGFAHYARVEGSRLLRTPDSLGPELAMAIGTGGYTAMLGVMALEDHGVRPSDGPVLVTGAGGGVGGFSVHLLAKAGYEVAAVTGRTSVHDYLKTLGAASIVERGELDRDSKPLESDRWAGVVDAVGGRTLATAMAQTRRGGAIAVCGNAGGFRLETTVFPLILRGVALLGIDSNYCPIERRREAWKRLAADVDRSTLDEMYETVPFDGLMACADRLMAGDVRGRVVVLVQD